MELFEAKLAQATTPGPTRGLLGAIGLVVNGKGETLYHHASGFQSLASDAPPLDPDSTVGLASAAKFITNIAALQLVERGLITLDEPLSKHLPELDALPLITRDGNSFTLSQTPTKITLRHLLLHTSGLSSHTDPLIHNYLQSLPSSSTPNPPTAPNLKPHPITTKFSIPLKFPPGQGFTYGYSAHWTQLLIIRLTSTPDPITGHRHTFPDYIQQHIFNSLNMSSSTYFPQSHPSIWARRLQLVERDPASGNLLPVPDEVALGITLPLCSVADVGRVLGDLISEGSKLLSREEHRRLMVEGQFRAGSEALRDLRGEGDNYVVCFGEEGGGPPPGVNWSAAGLVVDEEGGGIQRVSGMPAGTVTWEGMPNVMWAVSRGRGVAVVFATQVVPWGDERAFEVAREFMKCAWGCFGG